MSKSSPTCQRAFRSYVAPFLPSSFTRVLSRLGILPDHLCRFGVRFDVTYARGFPEGKSILLLQHRSAPRRHAASVLK